MVQYVREKMTCRSCKAITQPPAPSHPVARGLAGPQLLVTKVQFEEGILIMQRAGERRRAESECL